MRLRGKSIADLSPADLQALITNGVGESRILEYKLQLPGTSGADKKEFLAVVTGMANTDGGAILYGVETGALLTYRVTCKGTKSYSDATTSICPLHILPK